MRERARVRETRQPGRAFQAAPDQRMKLGRMRREVAPEEGDGVLDAQKLMMLAGEALRLETPAVEGKERDGFRAKLQTGCRPRRPRRSLAG